MTCVLTEPRRLRDAEQQRGPRPTSAGGSGPTHILDTGSPGIAALAAEVAERSGGDLDRLRAAHALIRARVSGVYALQERQPASRTLARGTGSCSQRLAVLEAVARRLGIATRSRALLVSGQFWRNRFPVVGRALPKRVLLAWPEFSVRGGAAVDGSGRRWLDIADLFAPAVTDPADAPGACEPFRNVGADTLFDALARGAVDWRPESACGCGGLSESVLAELGEFASRDAVFDAYGENLCSPLRVIVGPFLGARAAAPLGAGA